MLVKMTIFKGNIYLGGVHAYTAMISMSGFHETAGVQ